jgi:hypothetical protein
MKKSCPNRTGNSFRSPFSCYTFEGSLALGSVTTPVAVIISFNVIGESLCEET